MDYKKMAKWWGDVMRLYVSHTKAEVPEEKVLKFEEHLESELIKAKNISDLRIDYSFATEPITNAVILAEIPYSTQQLFFNKTEMVVKQKPWTIGTKKPEYSIFVSKARYNKEFREEFHELL